MAEIGTVGEKTKYINVLACGHSKMGKTVWASTAPNPLWFDFEHGLASLRGDARKQPVISFEAIQTKKERPVNLQVRDIIRELRLEKGDTYDFVKEHKIETLVFDSITGFADLLSTDTLVQPFDDTPIKPKERNGALELQDYNWILNRVWTMVRDLNALPYNFVALAGIESRQDDAARRKDQPMVVGNKLGDKLGHFFDDVLTFDYDDKKGKYTISTEPSKYFKFSGSRNGIPPGVYENKGWDTFKEWWS